jgi:O-antigen/teichoic acid export membrane protein
VIPTAGDSGEVDVRAPEAVQGRGLAANVSALATSQAITWTVTLLWTVVVPRAIGPQQMGLLTTGLSAAAILGVVLGVPTRDFVAREMVADHDRRASLLGTSLVLRLALTPVFLVLMATYAAQADLGRDGTTVLYLCAAATLCTLFAEPALASFQAVERMEFLAYTEVLNRSVQSFGGIALALLGVGIVGITSLTAAVSLLVLGLSGLWARRLVGMRWRTSLRGLWTVLRDSAPYWLTGVFFMLYLWVDAVMLGLLVPSEVVGWYGVATKLFTTTMFLPALVATAFLPRLVRAFTTTGYDGLTVAARVPVEAVLVLGVPVCVGTTMAAHGAIALLYGPEFAGAADVLFVLGCCVPLMYLNIMINQVLIAARRPVVWAWVLAGAGVVNICLNLVLIPAAQDRYDNGAVGAASAMLLTEVAVVSVGLLLVGRRVVPVAGLHRVGRAVLAGAVMWGVMRVAEPAGVLVESLLGVLAFALAAHVLRVLSPDQRRELGAAAARLLGRVGSSRRAGR